MTQRRSLKKIIAQSLTAVAITTVVGVSAHAAPPSILNMFQERTAAGSEEHLALKDEHGPWLILAMTFTGDDAEAQAVQLAKELRQTLNAPTYVHRKEFDHSQPLASVSQRFNAGDKEAVYTKRVRHANASHTKMYAVLVGNYTSDSDKRLEEMLQRVKTAQPACLAPKADDKVTKENVQTKDTNWLISTKRMMLWQKSDRSSKKGKMGAAFVTRNPLLPDDYFQNSVDDFVVDINKNVDPAEQCLLNCKKRYTVRVASFYGRVVTELASGGMAPKAKDEGTTDMLNEAGDKAHKLTTELRKRGVEAYEFHDRDASYVTIGAFDSLGEEAPNGGPFIYNPEMVSIMNQYCGYSVRSFTDGKTGYVTQTPTCKTLTQQSKTPIDPELLKIPFDIEGKFISVPRASTAKLYQGSLLGKLRIKE